MTDNREQSQTAGFGWHEPTHTVSADELGPFQLAATDDAYERDENGYYEGTSVRLRLYDSNTDTFLIDREATPVFGETFSTLDATYWKVEAERAIAEAGYDLDEVFAQARQDNAA